MPEQIILFTKCVGRFRLHKTLHFNASLRYSTMIAQSLCLNSLRSVLITNPHRLMQSHWSLENEKEKIASQSSIIKSAWFVSLKDYMRQNHRIITAWLIIGTRLTSINVSIFPIAIQVCFLH